MYLILAAALICIACVRRTAAAVVVMLAAGFIVGIWRGSVEQISLAQYKPLYGKMVTVHGSVSDDASYGPGGDQRLIISDVYVGGSALPGRIWISADSGNMVKRSDIVVMRGKLGFSFGSLAASMFHAQLLHVTHPQPGDIGLAARDWFASGISTAIPEPEASLAAGYLIGQRSTLPSDLDTQLKTVGLTHAVVASGYNLTILIGVAKQLLLSTSKYLATLSAATLIVGFITMSGLSPSMARAGLVSGLSLAAWYYGRTIHPLVLLPVAAALTVIANPYYVWGDIGWYLSFASFAGVIILAPLLQHMLWHGAEKPGAVMQVIVDTMSAQIATLPIMVLAFGHYSPYALLANLLVLPLIPLTMLATFIAGFAGLVLPAAAHIVGLPATLVLRYMTWVIARVADLPGAQGDISINIYIAGVCYALIGAAAVVIWRKTRYSFRHGFAAETLQNSE